MCFPILKYRENRAHDFPFVFYKGENKFFKFWNPCTSKCVTYEFSKLCDCPQIFFKIQHWFFIMALKPRKSHRCGYSQHEIVEPKQFFYLEAKLLCFKVIFRGCECSHSIREQILLRPRWSKIFPTFVLNFFSVDQKFFNKNF